MADTLKLPHSQANWDAAAVVAGTLRQSLNDIRNSGSKITYQEFLLLRSYWPTRLTPANDLPRADWIPSEAVAKAGDHLERNKDWQRYLKALVSPVDQQGPTPSRDYEPCEGSFSLVRYYQRLSSLSKARRWDEMTPKVTSPVAIRTRSTVQAQDPFTTPSRPPRTANETPLTEGMAGLSLASTPGSSSSGSVLSPNSPMVTQPLIEDETVEDEQIINTALILFLNALTIQIPTLQRHWTLFRRPFRVNDPQGQKIYEARVDGLLRSQHNAAEILVEVKPCYRCGEREASGAIPKKEIRMQETAQMAAWIYESAKTDPLLTSTSNRLFRRLLVSQDQQEIFVTMAAYDTSYVNYLLQTAAPNSNTFLVMKDYGPFNVSKQNHMKLLGKLLLAFSMNGGA